MVYRTPPDDPRSQALAAARYNNDREAEWLIEHAERVDNGWTSHIWRLHLPGGVEALWCSAGTFRFYEGTSTQGVVAAIIRLAMQFEQAARGPKSPSPEPSDTSADPQVSK